jgi:ABC-type polysaccharide/polyol phosphate export permease
MKKLLRAECIMFLDEFKQYKLNNVFGILSTLVVFIGLFSTVSGENQGAVALLFGLTIWKMCTSSMSYFSEVIEDEARLGTLEQIFMTRTTIYKVLFVKALVSSAYAILQGGVLFTICAVLFRQMGAIGHVGAAKLVIIVVIGLITQFSFYGMGMLFGGMALLYKRTSNFVGIVTYVLLFFSNITVPVENLLPFLRWIAYILPMTWANGLIEGICDGAGIGAWYLCMWVVSMAGMMLVGVVCFQCFLRRAKNLGKLGHY